MESRTGTVNSVFGHEVVIVKLTLSNSILRRTMHLSLRVSAM